MLGEELLSESPVQMEVLGEKHGDDHAHPIVHESSGEELSNTGVDDGDASLAGLPRFKLLFRFIPGKAAPNGIKLPLQYLGKVVEDLEVKLPPSQFLKVLGRTTLSGFLVKLAD